MVKQQGIKRAHSKKDTPAKGDISPAALGRILDEELSRESQVAKRHKYYDADDVIEFDQLTDTSYITDNMLTPKLRDQLPHLVTSPSACSSLPSRPP